MRRPLGCMTFSALIAAIVAVLAIVAVILANGNGIFSPGALSAQAPAIPGTSATTLGGATSHASLEGRCDACHTAIWSGQKMGDRCLACHTEVGQQIATAGGMHGRLEATAATCLRCHTEHHGTSASSTLADPLVFPHDQTGFALTAHLRPAVGTSLGCRECHPASPVSYTSPTCIGCHQQLDQSKMAAHVDTFGPVCLNCHDGKDTYGKSYVHATYPLTGKHEAATCGSCHKGSSTLAALRSTPTDCLTCHGKNDVHQGRLGTGCGSCHNAAGWGDATLAHTTQTRYALTGKHVGVACLSCHAGRQWTGIGTDCASCHTKDDAHAGQLGSGCAACHQTTGWKPATFDHTKTSFPLASGHAAVACASCHTDGKYAGTATTCVACHAAKDKHSGVLGTDCAQCHAATAWTDTSFDHSKTSFQLASGHVNVACASCHTSAPPSATATTCVACHAAKDKHNGTYGTDCAQCHRATAWSDTSFDHSNTSFPLASGHVNVACASCHTGGKFAGTPTSCVACHAGKDKHNGVLGTSCGSCHRATTWSDASFNHNAASYRLTGAHVGVTCERCHTSAPPSATPTTCVACHASRDTHNGALGRNCASCHQTSSWSGASFDHSKTSFPLASGHVNVACASCHQGGTYAGTPTSCGACHASNDKHNGVLGTNCVACHKATTWSAASFNHSTSLFKLTGAHVGVACERCHTSAPPAATPTSCVACHVGKDKHNGALGTNCASCHTTSSWSGGSFNHSKASFKLTGAHASLACERCHTKAPPSATSTTCGSCHAKPAAHDSHFGGNCASCHTTGAWRPAAFDHAKTSYKLTGAHLSVTCLKCHHSSTTYAGAATSCSSCHTKPASHTSAFGSSCGTCHSTGAWKPATFNHSTTSFKLTGAHVSLTCQKCHTGSVFTGLPTTCVGCHTKPSSHPSSYGTVCTACHTTSNWTPTSGAHTFPQTHGRAGGVCATCHPNSPPAYSCAKCHNPAKIDGHAGRSSSACASCHPKGKGGG